MEKNERPQNGAETWEWDVFENRLESVWDFKFCYDALAAGASRSTPENGGDDAAVTLRFDPKG